MSLSTVSVFAATNSDFQKPERGEGNFAGLTQEERTAKMEEMKVAHEAIEEAVISGDYEAWVKLVAEMPRVDERLAVITKDNFAKFSEVHKLTDELDDVFTELGIERCPMGGKGFKGKGMGMKHAFDEVNQE